MALSVNQITSIRRMVKLFYTDEEIAKFVNSSPSTIRNYVKNIIIQDPRKLPENKIVSIQILVRRKFVGAAVKDFNNQAKEKYK